MPNTNNLLNLNFNNKVKISNQENFSISKNSGELELEDDERETLEKKRDNLLLKKVKKYLKI